jgi:hypothetical protein
VKLSSDPPLTARGPVTWRRTGFVNCKPGSWQARKGTTVRGVLRFHLRRPPWTWAWAAPTCLRQRGCGGLAHPVGRAMRKIGLAAPVLELVPVVCPREQRTQHLHTLVRGRWCCSLRIAKPADMPRLHHRNRLCAALLRDLVERAALPIARADVQRLVSGCRCRCAEASVCELIELEPLKLCWQPPDAPGQRASGRLARVRNGERLNAEPERKRIFWIALRHCNGLRWA